MLLGNIFSKVAIEVKTILIKIKTHFFTKEKVIPTKNIELSNTNSDETKTSKITIKDLEKSFELFEKGLIALSEKFSHQTTSIDDYYNHQTEWREVVGQDGSIKTIPSTEL